MANIIKKEIIGKRFRIVRMFSLVNAHQLRVKTLIHMPTYIKVSIHLVSYLIIKQHETCMHLDLDLQV